MLQSGISLDLTTWQTVMLGYLGQQAIAHAALVFATLTAAFTFASGFADRISPPEPRGRIRNLKDRIRKFYRCHRYALLYFGFNWFLLLAAVYAAGRTIFYGAMGNQVMLTSSFKDIFIFNQTTACDSISNITLTEYWLCMRNTPPAGTTSTVIVGFFYTNFSSLNSVSFASSALVALAGALLILILAQNRRVTDMTRKISRAKS
jgi:hypothetical protein